APFDTALPSSSKPLTSGLAEAASGTPMSVAAIAPRTATRASRLRVPTCPISDVSLRFPKLDANPVCFPLELQAQWALISWWVAGYPPFSGWAIPRARVWTDGQDGPG